MSESADMLAHMRLRTAELETYIGEQPTLYMQIAAIHHVSNEIIRDNELREALSVEFCQPLITMIRDFLATSQMNEWLKVPDDEEEWPTTAEHYNDAREIIEEIQEWTKAFARRWHLLSEQATDIGAVDPTEVPIGWFDLSVNQTVRDAALETAEAVERFIRLWQRCAIIHDPSFLFDAGQRHRLVQACEALLGVLRAELVERNLASSVSKRAKLAQLALAAAIALVTGAATGIGEGALENYSPGKIAEARATETAAKNLGECLTTLDRTLNTLKPDNSSGPRIHERVTHRSPADSNGKRSK